MWQVQVKKHKFHQFWKKKSFDEISLQIVYMKFLEKKIKNYQYSHSMNVPQYVGPNENYKWWMFFKFGQHGSYTFCNFSHTNWTSFL